MTKRIASCKYTSGGPIRISVYLATYAGTRHFGAGGPINFLPLSRHQLVELLSASCLFTLVSLKLMLQTCCSSSAPRSLEPRIALLLSWLIKPSFTPTRVSINSDYAGRTGMPL